MIQSVKGTHDVLPSDSPRWRQIETALHNFMQLNDYAEIRTPTFEKTELFARGIGAETDIVSKEMYTWIDQGGQSLTLKPELTAPVVRAFIQHNLAGQTAINRLYYLDALFRRERPQKGRTRQFHQFGAEVFGSEFPEADAEIIALCYNFFKSVGVQNITLRLNSIGSTECRKHYRNALRNYLKPHLNELTETSQKRFKNNPLRILDTKIPHEIDILKNAPAITNFLTDEDNDHFNEVKLLLENLSIPFIIDSQMVRGLDYYSRTTFEIISKDLGAQDALCGGGRYDNLVEMLDGKPTPAVGFAAGIERLLLALESQNLVQDNDPVKIYVIGLTDATRLAGQVLAQDIRLNGFSVATDLVRRSLKSQLRDANRCGAKVVIILDGEEFDDNKLKVKNMATGEQITIPKNNLITYLQNLEF